MKIPVKTASAQLLIKGSRFLGESFILQEQGQVRSVLKEQKQKYSDATHVCHAFVFGKNAEIMGMSDDGEPGGTAGRPMLDVLKGSGSTNVLVTVTRWFGGTLLGTGGLVHAYKDCAKAVLEATVFEELVEKRSFSFLSDYQSYQAVRKIMEDFSLSDLEEHFLEGVEVTGKLPEAEAAAFKNRVFDGTNGKVSVILV
ncbi:MAG: YigZ family protein [Spirochaetia bacterium]|uniref:IMPACT family protein n=1 Tax=Treponema berlinense TaxID=225004 RepID=UPI0015C1652F|nr:YigZ family protein [Treponema berlinense]MDD5790292.1 YigZ family protein [Spirochaetia bacterium]